MSGRMAVIAATLFATLPAAAGELRFDDARRLIAGKLFSYSCFDGTAGAGRIHPDGSVSGTIRIQGKGPLRYVALPAGTLHSRGGSVCATVKGLPISPCFHVVQSDPNHFRGSIYGLGFAYCDFVQRGARTNFAARAAGPRPILPNATTRDE